MYSQRGKKYIYSVDRANNSSREVIAALRQDSRQNNRDFSGHLTMMKCSHFMKKEQQVINKQR